MNSYSKDSNSEIVVYEPNQRIKIGFFKSWAYMARNIWKSRELIFQLFKRDFLSGYKQSLLGIFWIFISPFVGILSWVFLNMTGVLNPGEMEVPYTVYVLIGSTFWGLFMALFNASSASLRNGSSLILQIDFPHEALVVKEIANTIAGFLISTVMIAVLLLIYRVTPSWTVMLFPLTLIPIILIGVGIGMVVAVITVVAHDINKIVSMGLGFLMFLTPVIYTPKIQNELIQIIIRWNPLSYIITAARDVILFGRIENPIGYLLSSVFALLLFLFSWRLFFLSEYKVAEKL